VPRRSLGALTAGRFGDHAGAGWVDLGLGQSALAGGTEAPLPVPVERQADHDGDHRGVDGEVGEAEAAPGDRGLDPVDDTTAERKFPGPSVPLAPNP
jgi:hypothetical protein